MTSRRSLGFIELRLPTVAQRPPSGPRWVQEIKHHGYRLVVRKAQADINGEINGVDAGTFVVGFASSITKSVTIE